ncbi:MAG: hypothetical protein IJB59_01225 [Oscillospiraceae bacterium]|nr:hypothetical protein [Oscillospiraceae bacterium]
MQLKTSFFNKTIFRKNLTRFAPVWGVYTLCLILGILLMYGNGGTAKFFHFARNMAQLVEIMGLVNMGYALVVAQLLFGDLYNSRMCNMLHAFPMRRETWFLTNLASGLLFSLVPTLIMAIVATPLLLGSLFENACILPWYIFLASNLQFVCFFGMAAFCAMAVGNRFTMIAGYGLLNAGAYIAYWLVDTVYTPMLYGVVTPTALAENLTPISHMVNHPYIQVDVSLYDLREKFGEALEGATAVFAISDEWWRLWMLAGAGLIFALLGLLLYRARDLECAGDAVAFPVLKPVFLVLCSVFVAAAAQFFLYAFMGMNKLNYMILIAGLVVGWFVAKMLLERSTRVFRLKNLYGLAALAAVFAVSLWLTHVDILGIETYIPDGDKIKMVSLDSRNSMKMTESREIEDMLRLHADALENRAEDYGVYIQDETGARIHFTDFEDETEYENYYYAVDVALRYELESGKIVRRNYNIWVDSEAGRIAEDYMSRWENVDYRTVTINGKEYNRLTTILNDFEHFVLPGYENERELPELCRSQAAAMELIAAIKADCEAGNMAQHPYFHTGHFRIPDEYAEKGYYEDAAIYISFRGADYGWSVNVFADCENTIRWLKAHDLLTAEHYTENIRMW